MKRSVGRPKKPGGPQENYNLRLPPEVRDYYKKHPGTAKKILIDTYNLQQRLVSMWKAVGNGTLGIAVEPNCE